MVSLQHRWLMLLTFVGLILSIAVLGSLGLLIDSHVLTATSYYHSGDFGFFWGAPQIARAHIATLFNASEYMAALQALYPPGGSINFNGLPYAYPLHSLFFYTPFSWLPFLPSLLLWTALGLTAYACSFWPLLPSETRKVGMVALLLAPACFVCVMTRQNGLFMAAGAFAVLVLLQHQRPILAGILLGILTIKPHLFILWPLMLLLEKQWRCLMSASLTTLILVGASVAVHGISAWQDYLTIVPPMQWDYTTWHAGSEKIRIFQSMMPGTVMALRLIGASIPVTTLLFSGMALAVAFAMARVWRRHLPLSLKALLLASGGLLMTPYAYNYDLPFLSAALILHWLTSAPKAGVWRLIGVLAFLLPVLVYVLNIAGVPLGPVILLLTFWGAVREASFYRGIKS